VHELVAEDAAELALVEDREDPLGGAHGGVARVAAETGTRAEPAETSLEDVFIRLMSVAEDTMA